MHAKSLKLSSEARRMRETYPSGRAVPVSAVPLIRQPFGLPPSPEGKAKGLREYTYLSSTRQRPSGARETTGRTDALALFPLASGSRPSIKMGICEQVYTKRLFFGGLGRRFFSSGKEMSPRFAHVPTCNQSKQRTARRLIPAFSWSKRCASSSRPPPGPTR